VFNAIGSGVLVTPFNNLNKPDFSYDEAAIHLTRTLRKFNDGVPGGSNNELGTSASLTWAFAETPLTLNVNNVPTQLDQVTIAQMEFITAAFNSISQVADITFTRIGTGTTGASAFSDSANISFSNFGDYDGNGFNYDDDAVYYQDSRQYSVMSYFSEQETGALYADFVPDDTGQDFVYVGGFPTNLMLHDIAALQRLYGANTDVRSGDTILGI